MTPPRLACVIQSATVVNNVKSAGRVNGSTIGGGGIPGRAQVAGKSCAQNRIGDESRPAAVEAN